MHEYAGVECSWASHPDEHYIEMKYAQFRGRVEVADPNDGWTDPFAWRMERPNGATTRSSAPTAKGALNGLCGAMIVAHRQSREYDLEAGFQDLLKALQESRAPRK